MVPSIHSYGKKMSSYSPINYKEGKQKHSKFPILLYGVWLSETGLSPIQPKKPNCIRNSPLNESQNNIGRL